MIYKSTPSLDEKYLNHSVFLTLKKYINFYDSLAFGVFGMLDRGLLGLTTHNTYVFSAIQGTLDSIRLILTSGRINDTYALLRKYDDSTITNVYINLYLENESYKKRNDKLSIDKLIIKEIDSWVKGRMELPSIRKMLNYIEASKQIYDLYELLREHQLYTLIRNRCNDHMHFNSFDFMFSNDNQVYNKKRVALLDMFEKDLKNLFIRHFILLFSVCEHFMRSSDYVDHLDFGKTPPDGSEYWVSKYIKDIFEQEIMMVRPDVGKLFLDKTVMKFD